MSFRLFLKQVFSLNPQEDPELQKLREKHGIVTDEKDKDKDIDPAAPVAHKNKPGDPDYDVWEDIRNYRTYFFFGSWATRKFRPVGEDKLKKDLEKLEKKRQEEEERKRGEG